MAIIPGDWVKRQWRMSRVNSSGVMESGDPMDEYARAIKMFGIGERTGVVTAENPLLLQERQYIPDDQQWGEWVTIMKSEGEPHG